MYFSFFSPGIKIPGPEKAPVINNVD